MKRFEKDSDFIVSPLLRSLAEHKKGGLNKEIIIIDEQQRFL